MIEVVQGEGGVEPLDAEYIKAVRALTEAQDVLLIVDEVQTGNGRLGTLFGYPAVRHPAGYRVYAKGLAGGLPMGACLLGEKVEHTLSAGDARLDLRRQSRVRGGGRRGDEPADGRAAIDVTRKKGEYIKAELGACPSVKRITGYGLMLGIQTTARTPRRWCKRCLIKGVVTLTAKEKLRLLPPLTIPWEQLKQAVAVIKEELQALSPPKPQTDETFIEKTVMQHFFKAHRIPTEEILDFEPGRPAEIRAKARHRASRARGQNAGDDLYQNPPRAPACPLRSAWCSWAGTRCFSPAAICKSGAASPCRIPRGC